jgi:hypothetical protein
MRDWKDAIAEYLAAHGESGENIFARLNAIRCVFAIRHGDSSYISLCDDGGERSVAINWSYFELEGFKRPTQSGPILANAVEVLGKCQLKLLSRPGRRRPQAQQHHSKKKA